MKYKIECWNPWSKENLTPFESSEKAVGDGEHKLGTELGIKPFGQNSKFDLKVRGEYWEVKKLDDDNSFRLGVEVSSSYSNLRFSVINIFSQLTTIEEMLVSTTIKNKMRTIINLINSLQGKSKTKLLDGFQKNEVSESNLELANHLIEELKSLTLYQESLLELYSSYDGKKYKYSLLDSFIKISKENLSDETKISLFGDHEVLDKLLIHSKIGTELNQFKNISLENKLNYIVRNVFSGLRLVLVHKEKGFKPIQNLENIYCNRITSGNPRCKYNDNIKTQSMFVNPF